MTRTEIIKELRERPQGEFTKNYLMFLRMLNSKWSGWTDEQLVTYTIAQLTGEIPQGRN